MRIRESHLRQIIREALHRVDETVFSVPAAAWQMYGNEKSSQGLSTAEKAWYVYARAALDATPAGAREYATGRLEKDDLGAFEWDGIVPKISAAAVGGVADLVMPSFVDNDIWRVISFFDPTGAMSWPALFKAWSEYSKDDSSVNGALLLLSVLGVIPLLGSTFQATRFATSGLKLASGADTAAQGVASLPKIKTVVSTFSESGAKWTELVDTMKSSGALRQISSKASEKGVTIDPVVLYGSLRKGAILVDESMSTLKYIAYVVANAKGDLLTAAIERFSGKREIFSNAVTSELNRLSLAAQASKI